MAGDTALRLYDIRLSFSTGAISESVVAQGAGGVGQPTIGDQGPGPSAAPDLLLTIPSLYTICWPLADSTG